MPMDRANVYETELDRNPANYAPLTPLSFVERAAYVYPERTAVVHGARRYLAPLMFRHQAQRFQVGPLELTHWREQL